MVQKRPLDSSEEFYNGSSKQPKQLERSNELVSVLDLVPSEVAILRPFTPVAEGGFLKSRVEDDEKLPNGIITELSARAEDSETNVSGCMSNSSWATGCTIDEDGKSEAVLHGHFPAEHFSPDHPIRKSVHAEDIYSYLLNHPPRKHVPIGSDHQADIPTWIQQNTQNNLKYLGTSEPVFSCHKASDLKLFDNNDEKRLMGTCVIPMPISESSAYNDKVGNGRTDCGCLDRDSVRCTRQHIIEAREELSRTLGQDKFVDLGFCDMGEEVADKWGDEEERLFHEVIFSNPSSSGKNFWNILSLVFPYRATCEIVSYYFNVFMLRRRAEQNRYDHVNIDSDNDEWLEDDDYGDDDLGVEDEDEDSVIESPIYDDACYHQFESGDVQEYDEDGVDEVGDNNQNVSFGSFKVITNAPEACLEKIVNNCGLDREFQISNKIPWEEKDEQDVLEDSCTSSDTGTVTREKADNCEHWPGSFNGLNSGGGGGGGDGERDGYDLESCDAEVWDAGYTTSSKDGMDFLPTFTMIEEVFGDGAWNHKVRDGKDLS